MTTRLSPAVRWGVGAILLLLLLPFLGLSSFTLHNMIIIFLYAAMAVAWNILGGLAGQHSMGHAAFMGIAAYTSTLLFIRFNISPWIGMLVGMALVAVFNLIIAYPTLRLRGPFFTLASIAVLEVLRRVAIFWRPVTEGSVGLTIPFKPGWVWMVWQDKKVYYFITLAALVGLVILTHWIRNHRMGYYLRALRADEDAAAMLGVNTTRVKLTASMLSAVMMGMLGTIYAQYVYFIEPDSVFSLDFSIQLVLFSIIGGMDSTLGPVLGAALITPLNEYLRGIGAHGLQGLNFFVYGIALIVVVILIPNGIIPTVLAWWERRRSARAAGSHAKGVS